MSAVQITGVGIHPFGRFDDRSVTDMGVTAVRAALAEAEWHRPGVAGGRGGDRRPQPERCAVGEPRGLHVVGAGVGTRREAREMVEPTAR